MVMKPAQHRHAVTVVEPGVLYRSGQLTPDELEEEIRRRGIKTVVNLGSQTDWDRDVCRRLGVKLVEIPVGDVWCIAGEPAPGQESRPAAPYDLTQFWKLVEAPESRPVLMHCWGGVHRTGVLTAMYRIRYQGWTAGDAITEMDLYGFDSPKDKFAGVLAYLRGLSPGERPAAHVADERSNGIPQREPIEP
jgi:protein tyrosine/serine phosphatase